MGLAHNLLLTRSDAVGAMGWLHLGQLKAQARAIIERFGVKAGGPMRQRARFPGGIL